MGIRLGPTIEQRRPGPGVGLRSHRRPTAEVSAVMLVVVLILSACGQSTAVVLSDEALVRQYLSWGDPESQDSIQRRWHATVQDAVAKCMDLRGFEYTPVSLEASGFGPGTGISQEDFAGRFGFGVTTNDAYFAAAMGVAARNDPNDEYLDSLEQQERRTYDQTFISCMDTITQDVGPAQSFIQEVRRLEDSVRRTPEAINAQGDWVTCMVLDDDFTSVRSLEELTSLLQVEYEDAKNTPDVLTGLQEREIDLAIRNLGCEKELNDRLAVTASDLERAFIDENQEEIADQRSNLGG